MRKINALYFLWILLLSVTIFSSGCTLIFQKGRRKDVEQITKLQNDYSSLKDQLSELERAKKELEDRLRNEINNKDVSVSMDDKGLVITFLAEVLFDSGKADLKSSALEKLDRIANVFTTTVAAYKIGVEGHTDNQPIKHSNWKSNWELSAARALSVVHYLIDEHGLEPLRLSATGYGEYHPIDGNDTKEGQQKNRRVEIVVLPNIDKEHAKVEDENLK